uniref:DUF834 domain-containing protein n=1 Tax=Oryza brachyantha TaxID=4533 RepID=J3L2H8_ORYBR
MPPPPHASGQEPRSVSSSLLSTLLFTPAPTRPVANPNEAGGVEAGDGGVGQGSTLAGRQEDGGGGFGVATDWGGRAG